MKRSETILKLWQCAAYISSYLFHIEFRYCVIVLMLSACLYTIRSRPDKRHDKLLHNIKAFAESTISSYVIVPSACDDVNVMSNKLKIPKYRWLFELTRCSYNYYSDITYSKNITCFAFLFISSGLFPWKNNYKRKFQLNLVLSRVITQLIDQ